MNRMAPSAKMRALRLRAIAILFVSASFPLLAQEAEPEEPGIILPPTLLRVEDLQVEEISAIIPEEDVQLLPEISVPLPRAEEIFLPEERFDIPYPDQLALVPGGAVRAQRTIDMFSEGEIAVGSMNHVRGDLTLFRLGPDPRFDLRFYHDKLDGYGLRPAGSGFYHSDDLIEGNISYTSGKVDIRANAGITESSEGLQRIGEFESLTYRRIYGETALGYPPAETLLLSGTIAASYAEQILSAATPAIGTELDLKARIGFGWETRFVDLRSDIGYGLLHTQAASHNLDFALSSLIKPGEALFFNLGAGVVWHKLADFLFPFSLSGVWQPSDLFSLEAGGGYFADFPTYAGLRDEYRFVDQSETLSAEYGWFSYADTQIRMLESLILSADIQFRYYDSVYQVSPRYSEVTGLFPLELKSDILGLQAGLRLSYSLKRLFNFSLSWKGRFIGGHPYEPAHKLAAGFSYRQPDDIFGTGLDLSIPVAAADTFIPELALHASYRLTESVRMSLHVSDPLSPLIPNGRTLWAPYAAPGFHAYLGMNISL